MVNTNTRLTRLETQLAQPNTTQPTAIILSPLEATDSELNQIGDIYRKPNEPECDFRRRAVSSIRTRQNMKANEVLLIGGNTSLKGVANEH